MKDYSWNLELNAKEVVCLLNLLKYLLGKIEMTETVVGTTMFTCVLFEHDNKTLQSLLAKVEESM